jgi:thiamine biosynthesis lipoprotein
MTAATDAARHAPFDTRATPDEPAADVAHVEHVMGTAVSLHLRVRSDARAERSSTSTESDGLADHLLERACAELHRADALFSTWRPESPMSRVRCGSLAVSTAPREIRQVLDLCADVRRLTGGWFDPWAMPGGVDPTGLVKGWAVERALDSVRRHVVAGYVNAGGDIAVVGRPGSAERWRMGVRHPWRPDALACVVFVESALATSGTYERGSHLFDPRARRPSARAVSASVVGPSLAVADGLATALCVGGDDVLDRLAEIPGYEGYLVRTDGTEAWTQGMPFAD